MTVAGSISCSCSSSCARRQPSSPGEDQLTGVVGSSSRTAGSSAESPVGAAAAPLLALGAGPALAAGPASGSLSGSPLASIARRAPSGRRRVNHSDWRSSKIELPSSSRIGTSVVESSGLGELVGSGAIAPAAIASPAGPNGSSSGPKPGGGVRGVVRSAGRSKVRKVPVSVPNGLPPWAPGSRRGRSPASVLGSKRPSGNRAARSSALRTGSMLERKLCCWPLGLCGAGGWLAP